MEQKSLTVVVEQPKPEPKTDYPSYMLAIAAILTAVGTLIGVWLKNRRKKR